MTTKTAKLIDLPAPVSAYFAADTTGAEAVAQCSPATVRPERQRNCALTWRRPSGMRIVSLIATKLKVLQ
jgi:hypothetical protein